MKSLRARSGEDRPGIDSRRRCRRSVALALGVVREVWRLRAVGRCPASWNSRATANIASTKVPSRRCDWAMPTTACRRPWRRMSRQGHAPIGASDGRDLTRACSLSVARGRAGGKLGALWRMHRAISDRRQADRRLAASLCAPASPAVEKSAAVIGRSVIGNGRHTAPP